MGSNYRICKPAKLCKSGYNPIARLHAGQHLSTATFPIANYAPQMPRSYTTLIIYNFNQTEARATRHATRQPIIFAIIMMSNLSKEVTTHDALEIMV